MTASLAPLQQQLQEIYGLGIDQQVDDFVFSDKANVQMLDELANTTQSLEKLFVRQIDNDNLDVSLYVDAGVLGSVPPLDEVNPLYHRQLASFCIALEGVSHFLYLLWNVQREHSVTQLEMELQAEVDKYVSLVGLNEKRNGKPQREKLRRWLFDEVVFDEVLSEHEIARYRDANRFAARYCRWLETSYVWSGRHNDMFHHVRHFYRADQQTKLRIIEHVDTH